MKERTVAVSGYFSPIHIGHLDMMEKAKMLGDKLLVIVNNDEQQLLKKERIIIPVEERARIVRALEIVDEVIIAIDNDETVCKTLEMIQPDIFANGGDRKNEADIPESYICDMIGCEMVFGVGGEKVDSSSRIIEEAGL